MYSRRPGVALVFALALGAASEAWGQQLVSGGNAADRTAHNQFLHQGDVIHVEDIFYSCVGGDLTAPTLFFTVPTGPGTPNVSFVNQDINGTGVGAPTALWDASGGVVTSPLGPAPPSFNSGPPTKQINIPISTNFLGASYRFFLQNVWVKADGGPSTGFFNGTNRVDVSSIMVVDGATATMPSATIFPGTTVGTGNIVITETSNAGHEGIWKNVGSDYGIRIQIPSGYGVTWDTTVGSIGNGGNGHVNTGVTYSADKLTVFITVNTSFVTLVTPESVTISGLKFVVDPAATDTDPIIHPPFKLNILQGQLKNVFAQCIVNNATTGISIKGVPSIASTANQVFTVGDPSTVIGDITITDSQGTQKIKSGTTLYVIIPASLNLQWDPAFPPTFTTPMTLGAVSFSGGNKIMNIPVTTNTLPGKTIVIHNAQFTNFSAANAAGVALQLQNDTDPTLFNDVFTNAIGRPTITSANDQVFVVDQLVTNLQTITIQDDATHPRIKNGVPFAIEIPAGLNLVFTGTVPAPANIGANLSTTVTFASGSPGNWKRVVLTPTADFGASGSSTVTNLEINVSHPNSIGSLALITAPAAGTACSTDPKILVIGSFPSMSSAATQQFTVNDPSTVINTVTITTDIGSAPLFQNTNSLQLIIPNTFFAEWNTAPASASLGGSASGKVNFAGITYPLSGGKHKILQLPITADWTTGDTLSFINFEMMTFTATCAGAGTSLQLRVSVGGSIASTDTNPKSIGQPIITSTPPNQAFGLGDASTLANKITIADDPVTPRLLGGAEVRIRIPNGFPMTWDNTVVPSPVFTVAGSGTLGTFATAAQYYYTNPQGDQVLRIPITGSFSANQTFQISNVRFQSFTAVHAATNLELEVNGKQAIANAFDTTHTLAIGIRPQISSITTQDQDSNGSIDHLIVTLDRALDPSSASIATGAGFTVAGYPIVSGNLDPTHQIITYTVLESGLADSGVTPTVVYDATVGSVLESINDLGLKSTSVGATDKAAPVIVNFTTTDADGNGHLDKMTFTFSENLSGTPNIAQWTVIDADGTTNLLAGLTNASIQIQNQNQLVITFSNTIGTSGTPRFQYTSNGVPGTLGDSATPSNLVSTTTNNHPPVANPGQARSLFPTVVSLDGSGSSDADAQPLTYTWSFVGFVPAAGVVPPNPAVTIVNATSPIATVQLNTAGVYTFKLAVSDGLAVSTATVAITIINVPPTAHAGPDQSVHQAGNFAWLDGSLSTDPNGIGDIQSYAWNFISGPPGAPTTFFFASGAQAGYSSPVTGTYVFELTVTDRAGNASKDRCFVRVVPGGVPTAVAGPDQVVTVNTQVKLDGRSSLPAVVPPGPPLGYQWISTNLASDPVGPLDVPTINQSVATFTPTGPGVYTFQLVVSHGAAITSVPDEVSVLVYDPANLPPSAVANLLTPVNTPVVGDTCLLDATGSADPEGAPLKYAWMQTRGPLVALTNATTARPSFIAPVTGYYEFQLTVNDGVQSSFPVKTGFNVIANAAATIPAGTVAAPASVLVGAPVTMTPSYTVAPVNYQWTQTAGPGTDLSAWNVTWGAPTTPSSFSPAPTVPGVYRFELSIWDGSQVLTVIPVSVIVNASAANVVPTAAGTASPTPAEVGQTVILDASGSTTGVPPVPLGGGSRYMWSQVSGPPVALSNASAVQPTFVPSTAGVYVFSLKVNDGSSDSPATLVVVTADSSSSAQTGGGGGGGGGGCGLGVEQLLLLPMLWTAAWFRRRGRRTGNG
jgi:hypothetical protein